MRTKYLACSVLILGVSALVTSHANAQSISRGEMHFDGSEVLKDRHDGLSGNLGAAGQRGTFIAFSEAEPGEPRRETSMRGIIGLSGPLGLILDYSSGMPRVRGLAFSPSDSVRIEASGSMDQDLDDVGGQISIHLRF